MTRPDPGFILSLQLHGLRWPSALLLMALVWMPACGSSRAASPATGPEPLPSILAKSATDGEIFEPPSGDEAPADMNDDAVDEDDDLEWSGDANELDEGDESEGPELDFELDFDDDDDDDDDE